MFKHSISFSSYGKIFFISLLILFTTQFIMADSSKAIIYSNDASDTTGCFTQFDNWYIDDISVCETNLRLGEIADYPFNGNANDESGNGHNGTNYGATLCNDRFGNENSAYYFDGINDYIDLGNWFNYQNFSLSVWVKQEDLLYYYVDIIDNNHTDYRNWVVQHNGGDPYHFGVAPQGSCYFSLPSNEWENIVCVKDEGTLKTYLNGVLQNELVTGNSTVNYNSPNLFIARWGGGGRYFNGEIDDIKMYDRALSQSEIDLLYNEGSATPSNVQISIISGQVTISWEAVLGATSYRVYSSNSATSGFTEDTSGTFNGTTWTSGASGSKKFYYITAVF